MWLITFLIFSKFEKPISTEESKSFADKRV